MHAGRMWVRPTCCLDALDHSLDLTLSLPWTIACTWLWAGFEPVRTPPKPPPLYPVASGALVTPPWTALDAFTFDVKIIAGFYLISDAFLDGFWEDFPPNLVSQSHLKSLKIEAKSHSIFGFNFKWIFDRFFIDFGTSKTSKIIVFPSGKA